MRLSAVRCSTVLVTVAALVCAGCSDAEADAADTASAGGTETAGSGGAGTGAAGSGAATGNGGGSARGGATGSGGNDAGPDQGAFAVTFLDTGAGCTTIGHNSTVGEVTATTKDVLVVDGQDGAGIECAVSGSGTFSVSAQLAMNADFLAIEIASIDTAATESAAAPGAVSFASATTAGQPYASQGPTCEFWFASPNQAVAPGRLWTTFRCAEILEGASSCEITQGTVILENCAE
jgi:hypothetical protein